MLNSWKIKKLGEVLKLEYGKPLPHSKRNSEGMYPVYGANGQKDRTDEYYYNKQSIIVGRKGSAGEVNLTEKAFWPLDVTYFVTFDDKKYDLNFIYHLLSNLDLPRLAKGVKPGINRNEVYSINVHMPLLPEQRRIVAILDKAFAAIAKAKENAEKNLQNTREIFQSTLQTVFASPGDEWKAKRLGEVCEISGGGTPDTKVLEYWNGQNLWITPKDMGKLEDIYIDTTERKITDAGLKHSSAKMLPIDSIILSSRAPIGYLAINKKKMATNQGCKGIVPKKELSSLFLFYFLKNSVELLNTLGSGTTFRELSGSKLEEVQIPLPPLPEQQRIVAKLDALALETKKLQTMYQQKLAQLEELKKSILYKAFNGELTGEERGEHI